MHTLTSNPPKPGYNLQQPFITRNDYFERPRYQLCQLIRVEFGETSGTALRQRAAFLTVKPASDADLVAAMSQALGQLTDKITAIAVR